MYKKIFNKLISLFQRANKQFLFAKSIDIDRTSIIHAGKAARVFGSISCINKSVISIDKNVVINKDSSISAANGGNISIGEGCQIAKGVVLNADSNNEIILGEKTTFFSNVLISGDVNVGNEVLFSSNINILSTTHCFDGRESIRHLDAEYIKVHGSLKSAPIIIGDGCWIGLNVVILPGSTLGRGCVVGANAVVRGSFEEFSVIGGIPAKLIKYR